MQGRQPGLTGVWTGNQKICAIGVKISHGITTHGLALNHSTELDFFKRIVPCGVLDKGVTSIAQELDDRPHLQEVKGTLARQFALKFGFDRTHKSVDNQPLD